MAAKKGGSKKAAAAPAPASTDANDTSVAPLANDDVQELPEEGLRIDLGESLPPFVNKNLNPDRAK